MKSFIITTFVVFIQFISISVFAQKNNIIVTDTIHVSGNCSMCKVRIEEAAYTKGVKTANWDKKTKVLTVLYRGDKTSKNTICNSILKAGHDCSGRIASESVYKQLPSCCAYRTGSCDH